MPRELAVTVVPAVTMSLDPYAMKVYFAVEAVVVGFYHTAIPHC